MLSGTGPLGYWGSGGWDDRETCLIPGQNTHLGKETVGFQACFSEHLNSGVLNHTGGGPDQAQCHVIWFAGLPTGPQGALQAMALHTRSGTQGYPSTQVWGGHCAGPRSPIPAHRTKQGWCTAPGLKSRRQRWQRVPGPALVHGPSLCNSSGLWNQKVEHHLFNL